MRLSGLLNPQRDLRGRPTDAQREQRFEREAAIELVYLHARMLKRMPWVHVGVAAGMWLLVWPMVPLRELVAWTVVTLFIECLRAYFGARALRHNTEAQSRRDLRLFIVLAGISGAGISALPLIALPLLSVEGAAGVAFVTTAIPAAGVAVSQSSRHIIAAYALAILLPSSYAWGMVFPDQAASMLAFAVVYSTVLILVAADNDKLLRRSIVIRHERDALVKDLEQRNADVRIAMAQAERSAQARARVLAAASHDLRQPLHALSVYSAVLSAKPSAQTLAEVSHDVDQIVRSLNSLLGGLLDLSRLSSDYYAPESTVCSLDHIVNGVCNELHDLATRKGLRFIRALQPVSVNSDPVALGRIARNLIDNAIKYTDQGEVTVSVWKAPGSTTEPDRAYFQVVDSGKGIAASEHTRIFEEFYQIDNPGRDRSRGVGLGLTIVQRLCELLPARIDVVSEPGQGSRFTVDFGSVVAEPDPVADDQAMNPETAFAGQRVYVVDDEIDIRRSMSQLLTVWGLRVDAADSPNSAEKLFVDQGLPDLLVADLRLGADEHGAAMADRLIEKYGRCAVLIMTGETTSEALREANQTGHILLEKPIAPEVLRRAIVEVLAARGPQTPSSPC